MNRSKILEKFSSKFKTRKFSEEFTDNDRKMKKERLRAARRAKMEEEEMTWESNQGRRDDRSDD